MKILWVSLVEFPPLAEHLGHDIPKGCGWLYSSAKSLLNDMPNIELGVIVYSYGKEIEEYHVDGISYYLVPCKSMLKTDSRQVAYCREALSRFSPDLIHIHGTEHSLAKAVCMANDNNVKVVASIQGLASGIVPFADGGLSFWDKLTNITPLDFYRGTFLLNTKRNMYKRAKCEEYVITHVTNIIGRTQWDKDHVMTINPQLHYHFMNETLRDSFYEEPAWTYGKCKKHTIFLSNSSSPLKGVHIFLKALKIVLTKYPDTVVNICGSSVLNNDLKTMLHFQGYHFYLRRLVRRMGLENHLHFMGALTEKEMKQAYLDANVYVLCSSIENSSNSLCEAQILGVPVVASYCGGTPSLVEDGKTGYLYRYEEIEMLAQRIMVLFDSENFSELSANEMQVAMHRHNKITNANRLIEIYKSIISCQ